MRSCCSLSKRKFKDSKISSGGALSDLESKVSNIETNYLRPPNISSATMVIERTSGVSGLPIVQNWDSVNHPFDSYTVPRDGWAGVIVHAENKKTNDITKHESTAINVSLNGIALGGAEASGTPTNHIESTNSYFLPVKAGDVFSWGGASTTAPPNGYFNTLRIRLFSYAGT